MISYLTVTLLSPVMFTVLSANFVLTRYAIKRQPRPYEAYPQGLTEFINVTSGPFSTGSMSPARPASYLAFVTLPATTVAVSVYSRPAAATASADLSVSP